MSSSLKTILVAGLVAAVVAFGVALLYGGAPAGDLLPMGTSSAGIQQTNNGDKLIVASGGEIEIQSGGVLDAQSGADATFASALTHSGAVTNSSTTALVGAVNLDGAVDLDGVITNADGLEHIGFPTYASAAFTYTAGAGGTVPLFTIGTGEEWIVHGVWLEVTSNFNATGDDAVLVIGDGNDADGFCVLADAELQTADTEGTGWSAGWQCQVAATRGVYQDGTGGFIYDEASTETIDAVISASGNDLSAGAATAHILYTRLP